MLALIRSIQKAIHPLGTQWPANENVINAQTQLQTLHEQFVVLLEIVRIERGTLVLMPRSAELGHQTDLEIADFNARFPTSAPAVLLSPAPSPAKCWVDAPRYRQMLRALLEYCFDLGLLDLRVSCHMTASAHAELLWELRVEPGPVSWSEGLAEFLTMDEINPQSALCAHMAELMGGALKFEQPTPGTPLALLSLPFTQST